MNTNPEQTCTTLGKLLFQTGLPQLFGLYPGDDLSQHKDDLQTLMGILKCLSRDGEINPQQMQNWPDCGAQEIRAALNQ